MAIPLPVRRGVTGAAVYSDEVTSRMPKTAVGFSSSDTLWRKLTGSWREKDTNAGCGALKRT